MSFLTNADKGTNLPSTYILTIVLVILAYILGQVPMLVDISIQVGGLENLKEDPSFNLVAFFGENKYLTYVLIPFILALVVIFISVRFLHKRPMLSVVTNRKSFDWRRFFTSLLIWGGIMGIFLAIAINMSDQISWNFKAETFFPLLMISLFLIPIQTSCEEILFRGYLLQGFGKIYKRAWLSVLVTGILFGLLHGANPEVEKLGYSVMIYYIGTGIFLGIIAIMDDGLELSLGYHAVNNIFAALILTNEWQAFQTDALYLDHSKPTFGWDSLLTIIIIQPFLLFIYSKIYKWTNWKEKLFGKADFSNENQ